MKEIAFIQVSSHMSGVEFSTLYLARQLDRSAWHVLVVCPEEGDLPVRCRASGIDVAIVPGPRFFSTSLRIAGRVVPNPIAWVADFLMLFVGARSLAGLLRARRPALVVTKGLLAHFYGGLAAKASRVPCVWHVQDRVSERLGPLFPWSLSLTGRLLAGQVIADAESIARQVRLLIPPAQVSVIWNGVDLDEFNPRVDGTRVRAEWGVSPDELLVGTVGRLTPWKGQLTLVRAFAQIANRFPLARVVFVGSALFDTKEHASTMSEEVKRLGLGARVSFVGFRQDLPQVLAALDIVAHTALEKDSSPLAVVSAMAAGKSIVYTYVDGTAELFEDDVDGLPVPPGDVPALAQKLGLLLKDAELRRCLGRAARAKAERELGIELFARRCEAVFERALR